MGPPNGREGDPLWMRDGLLDVQQDECQRPVAIGERMDRDDKKSSASETTFVRTLLAIGVDLST